MAPSMQLLPKGMLYALHIMQVCINYIIWPFEIARRTLTCASNRAAYLCVSTFSLCHDAKSKIHKWAIPSAYDHAMHCFQID